MPQRLLEEMQQRPPTAGVRWAFRGIAAGRTGYIVIAFCLFVISLMWSATLYELDHDRNAVLDTAHINVENSARAYSEHVFGTLRVFDQILLRVRDDYDPNASSATLTRMIRRASGIYAGTAVIAIMDAEGNLLATNKTSTPIPHFGIDRDFFQAQAQASADLDQVYIGEPIPGRLSDKQVIVLSRRINEPNGGFGGTVTIAFDPQFLSGFFSDLKIGPHGSFAILRRDTIVLDMIRSAGHDQAAIGKNLAMGPLLPALARAPAGEYKTVSQLDGVTRIYSYRTNPDYPVVVVAGVSETDIMTGFRWRQSRLLSVAAGFTLFFIVVAIYQLRRITVHARSERTLRQTQEVLLQSQRVAKLGYYLHNLQSGAVFWSEGLAEMRGVPNRTSFTVDESLSCIDPADRERYLSARADAIAERRSFSFDVRIRHPDNSCHWEHRVILPQFDARGTMVSVLGVVQDISESKEAELALARSHDNMARAQQVAAFGSFDFDLITQKTEWSDEMFRILGLDKDKTVPGAYTIISMIHPDDRDRFRDSLSYGSTQNYPGDIEYRIIRPGGAERLIRAERGLILGDDGKPVRVNGSLQDITEQRAAEESRRELEHKLMQSQKLEALGTMAGGIAHDLNNNLTPIMVLSKLTARALEPGELRENLNMVFAASERAHDLVKRVLAFSRQDKIDKMPCNLGDVVDEALKLLRTTIPRTIDLDIRIDNVPAIMADPSQIDQLVANLVTNAAQAIGDDNGTIAVTLERVADVSHDDAIRLSVIDTGQGIDDTTRERMFEPFFTSKAVGKGTGLGLSIVTGIVTEHGGRIEVDSAPGKGARFDIYFPIADKQLLDAA